MLTRCNCCGTLYPNKHMVTQNSSKKNYYIPHAIRIFGLFKDPQEIRRKLEDSELTDFLYIFPTDLGYRKNALDRGLYYGWREEFSSYGNYYWLDNR